MDLVYGFISRHNSLEDMIEERAREIAEELVLKTRQTVQIDNSRQTEKDIKKALKIFKRFSKKMAKNLLRFGS